MKQYAIIVAAGMGTRMGTAMPKQFLLLRNKPILFYSIQTFINTFPDIEIVLVINENYLDKANEVVKLFNDSSLIKIVYGGETRFESVQNGLQAIDVNIDSIVYVHDSARPFINSGLLQRLKTTCIEKNNAIPCLPITESTRIIDAENNSKPIDRNTLRIIQTPQVFKSNILLKAFQQNYNDSFTDEANVVQADGGQIFLVNGIVENIKITTAEQLIWGEFLMGKF